MKRLLLALMVLGSAPLLIAQTERGNVKSTFQSAETLSVTDIPIPTSSVAIGTVVLDAVITETGEIQGIDVRRDIATLTEPSESAVQGWSFSAATFEGKGIASVVPVAVTFRPPDAYAPPNTLPELRSQNEAAVQAEFQPAEVMHAAFPAYPPDTVAAGTVVLEVSVGARGEAEVTKVLLDLPPLTAAAKAVVGQWRFMPATFNGRPVEIHGGPRVCVQTVG